MTETYLNLEDTQFVGSIQIIINRYLETPDWQDAIISGVLCVQLLYSRRSRGVYVSP